MEKNICPLCSSEEVSFYLKRKDGLSVYLCSFCEFRFISKIALENIYGSIENLYEKEYYEEQGDFGYSGYTEIPITNFLWQRAFIELIDEVKDKKILDIGCGTGKLVELLMGKGAEVEGVEVSGYAVGIASSKDLKVIRGDIMSHTDSSVYDIITAFDIIEHVPDIKAFLNKVRTILKDDGVFIFLTPDAGSGKALIERENWYGYNSSLEHLYYFSITSLRYVFMNIFGYESILYQAVAPDGEGILGFIRKNPSERDNALKKLFLSNFSSEFINEENVIPVCILLQRLNDRRFIKYADKYRSFLSENADKEELHLLLSALDDSTTDTKTSVVISPKPEIKSKGKEVTIRSYQEGDEYGIVRLFKDVFGREMTIDEWRWKYRGQGSEGIYSVVAVNSDDEIVGHYGGVPLRTLYMGNEIGILSVCDVMIQPKSRGFWLLKRINAFFMQAAIKNGFKLCYGFPTEKTLMLPAEKLGIIERCTKIFDAKKDVCFNNNLNRFFFRLLPLNFDDERIKRLWEAVKGNLEFTVIRGMDYLRWRYRDNPVSSYELWGLTKRWGRNLYALAVLKKDSTENLLVADLIFKEDALIPLLQKVENLAYSKRKRCLILWMPEKYHPLLRENGFILKEYGVIGQFTGDDFISKDVTASLFYFGMGDTDYL